MGTPNLTNNSDGIHTSDTSLQPNGAQLHPSESNTPPPLGGKLLVNWASNGSPTTPPSNSKSNQPGWVEKPGALMSEPSIKGLQPPILQATGCLVKGVETYKLQLQNKQRQYPIQEAAVPRSVWTSYTGHKILPPKAKRPHSYRNEMCPAGIVTSHPAGELLTKWSQLGCPTKTGYPWTKDKMWQAVARGPHQSSLSPETIAHYTVESKEKV